jgi:hypothetical protein
MIPKWWEKPLRFLCDYWWVLLLLLLAALAAYFTRGYWMPEPAPVATPIPPATSTTMPTPIPVATMTTIPTVIPTRVDELGTGDVQVTLTWNSLNDLDLYVVDPAGETIYFSHDTSLSGGKLDVDANLQCAENITSNPVENIFWPTGAAPEGTFKVYVNYYAHCSGAPVQDAYTVRLLVDGVVQEFSGTVSAVGENDLITSFDR